MSQAHNNSIKLDRSLATWTFESYLSKTKHMLELHFSVNILAVWKGIYGYDSGILQRIQIF